MRVHTILYVANQQISTDFYRTIFNVDPTLNVPGMTEFMLSPDHILGLMPELGIKKLLGERLPDPSSASGIPRVEIYLKTKEAHLLFQRALKNGAQELSKFMQRDWGDHVAYALDPDGHVLAFAIDLS